MPTRSWSWVLYGRSFHSSSWARCAFRSTLCTLREIHSMGSDLVQMGSTVNHRIESWFMLSSTTAYPRWRQDVHGDSPESCITHQHPPRCTDGTVAQWFSRCPGLFAPDVRPPTPEGRLSRNSFSRPSGRSTPPSETPSWSQAGPRTQRETCTFVSVHSRLLLQRVCTPTQTALRSHSGMSHAC
jgi:hypothetical protein